MGFIGKCLARAGFTAVVAVLSFVPAAQASFPGQNGKIAFATFGGIYTINPDGSGLSQVVPSGRWPAWSADGRRLVYFADRPGASHGLNVANADGSGQVRIRAAAFSATENSSREDVFEEPAWSPDGGTIAYEAMEVACGGHGLCFDLVEGIRGITPDGPGDRLLIDRPGAGDPAYSPDGSRLAWSDHIAHFFPPHVHVSNADGSGDTVLTANGGGFDPSWSPDGTRIAFARYVGCCNPEIYVMNADGSDERRLTALDGFDTNPAWSPDGTKIAWERNGIWVMNADGSDQSRLVAGAVPDWQPLVGPRREDYKNASHFCKAEREFMGDAGFRQKYGSHGGCVSGQRK